MNPTVSVYIPTKNRLSLFKRAIASVLSQTFRDVEVVVVSDGSDDGTNEYIESLKSDLRIVFVKNKESLGACAARNQALEIAKGRFITGLDDDDFFHSNRVELFLKSWDRFSLNNVKFSCLFDVPVKIQASGHVKPSLRSEVDCNSIRKSNGVGNYIFTERERLIDVGMFDPNMPAWQDWDLWVRMIDRYGPALNTGSSTFSIDESHSGERISTSDAHRIYDAMQRFRKKYSLEDLQAQNNLLLVYSRYPKARVSIEDYIKLLSGFHFQAAFRILRQRKLGLRV